MNDIQNARRQKCWGEILSFKCDFRPGSKGLRFTEEFYHSAKEQVFLNPFSSSTALLETVTIQQDCFTCQTDNLYVNICSIRSFTENESPQYSISAFTVHRFVIADNKCNVICFYDISVTVLAAGFTLINKIFSKHLIFRFWSDWIVVVLCDRKWEMTPLHIHIVNLQHITDKQWGKPWVSTIPVAHGEQNAIYFMLAP